MRKAFVTLATMAVVSATFAWAPTLKNEDSRSYDLKIKDNFSTLNTSINSSTTQTLSGKNGALLTIVATGDTITVKDDKTYIIKDGTISEK